MPGDNGVDLYINDIGCVVIMEPDGETLAGFNIAVGGGMGRAHKQEATFARAASHLGFVREGISNPGHALEPNPHPSPIPVPDLNPDPHTNPNPRPNPYPNPNP